MITFITMERLRVIDLRAKAKKNSIDAEKILYRILNHPGTQYIPDQIFTSLFYAI